MIYIQFLDDSSIGRMAGQIGYLNVLNVKLSQNLNQSPEWLFKYDITDISYLDESGNFISQFRVDIFESLIFDSAVIDNVLLSFDKQYISRTLSYIEQTNPVTIFNPHYTGEMTFQMFNKEYRFNGSNIDDIFFFGLNNNSIPFSMGPGFASGAGGNDEFFGGFSSDTFAGGEGDDSLVGAVGDDFLDGGSGNDFLDGGVGRDLIFGDAGDDLIWCGESNDTVFGGNGSDTIFGDRGFDFETGDDLIWGGGASDVIFGWRGSDTLLGEDGDDLLIGEQDNDILYGWLGRDVLWGGDGNDVLWGEQDNDTLLGETGDDVLLGVDGDDVMYGWTGNDTLYGWAGADVLWGEDGNDVLLGEDGADTFIGGLGRDTMTGGADADRFFNAFFEIAAGEVDLITDYDAADHYLFQSGAQIQYFDFNAPGYGVGAGIHVQVQGGVYILDVFGATTAQLQTQTQFF